MLGGAGLSTLFCVLGAGLVRPGVVHAQEQAAARADTVRGETRADTIRAVVDGFHGALAAGDSTAALALLHPDVVIYESGEAETLAEYRSGHLAADIEFARSVEATRGAQAIEATADLAVYLRETRFRGSFRDREIDTRGVETMALVRTPDGWKILHIHWSSR